MKSTNLRTKNQNLPIGFFEETSDKFLPLLNRKYRVGYVSLSCYICNTYLAYSKMTIKSYEEINQRIRSGKAVVLTAEEVAEMGRTASPAEIVQKVDVVTTATFGAMCSSGAIINFGHASPPIRMEKIRINGVPAYEGLAAVDAYIGATACDPERPEYGGAHVIQELVEVVELAVEVGAVEVVVGKINNK